jgi:hypothetical protein
MPLPFALKASNLTADQRAVPRNSRLSALSSSQLLLLSTPHPTAALALDIGAAFLAARSPAPWGTVAKVPALQPSRSSNSEGFSARWVVVGVECIT